MSRNNALVVRQNPNGYEVWSCDSADMPDETAHSLGKDLSAQETLDLLMKTQHNQETWHEYVWFPRE